MALLRGLAALLALCLLWAGPCRAEQPQRPGRAHQVYFSHTPNELNVYRVYGARDGKTLMLIGGIQGDEPGGFLSADLYADIALAQGNLIVVPRANFLSIMQNNRGPDGDMNRQFGNPVTAQRHKQIVEVLKALMAESDLLLNLHDGSGFYRPNWESADANPKRYGQSLIADTDSLKTKDGKVIDLKAMAEKVLAQVNGRIEDPKYRIQFNNHRTASADTIHKEQRLSATYYALTQCGIPAFGVESSKSLPNVSMKILHHNLVINAFMEHMGIVPETPPHNLPPPEFRYLLVQVNQGQPVVVAKGSPLVVAPGDRINVQHIGSNYERGLSCDVEGVGSVNDLGHTIPITHPTNIVVRKDNQVMAKVEVRVDPHMRTALRSRLFYFLVDVEGQRRLVGDGEALRLVRGDTMTLVDVLSNLANQANLQVNFKGFVPPGQPNSAEDRGHPINTSTDLISRFSVCPSQHDTECYQVVATQGGKSLGTMTVEVAPARFDYLVMRRDGGHKLVYHQGETVEAKADEQLEVVDYKTNVSSARDLALAVDAKGKIIPLADGRIDPRAEPFQGLSGKGQGEFRLLVLRREQAIGYVQLKIGGR